MRPRGALDSMTLTSAARRELGKIVGIAGVVDGTAGLRVYECDGYTLEKARPLLVLLPDTVDQVRRIVSFCHTHAIPFVARGTGVSGGCLPVGIPVMIGTVPHRFPSSRLLRWISKPTQTHGCSRRI